MDLKTQLLQAAKRMEAVTIPELGNLVAYVKVMTGHEADLYQAELEKSGNSAVGLRLALLALTVCDEEGTRVFESAKELETLDTVAIDRLCKVALRLNALTKEAQEELEKKV